MSWDWEKLKEQQQKMGGGVPPNVDEIVQKMKNIKFPGGPLLIVVLGSCGRLVVDLHRETG
jgi:membrane protease subunit HflK